MTSFGDAIDHCSVIVTDVAGSRRFYGESLGLREIPAPKMSTSWPCGTTSAARTCICSSNRSATRSVRGTSVCTFRRGGRPSPCRGPGIPVEETVKIPGPTAFVRDPDGNRIEILEWQSKYEPEVDGRYRWSDDHFFRECCRLSAIGRLPNRDEWLERCLAESRKPRADSHHFFPAAFFSASVNVRTLISRTAPTVS